MTTTNPNVDQLIRAITAKLEANVEVIAKARSGRLTWRWSKQGVLEIRVSPEL